MKNLIKNFLSKIKTTYNYNINKEVKPFHLYYGQLQPKRSIDMLTSLNEQIKNFKFCCKNEKFVFVEIGSYLGESLKLFGNEINNKLDNFLLVSIDPYSPDTFIDKIKINEQVKSNRKFNIPVIKSENLTRPAKIKEIIPKIYLYFLNNVSNYGFKNNHIHLRMKSIDAFNFLKKNNFKIDFCYLDGSHYYNDIKKDYLNYSSIMRSKDGYNGMLCGDDYELDLNSSENFFDFSKEELEEFLKNNLEVDYLFIKTKNGINKKNKLGFHPGVTLFFSEISDKIKRFDSGFWKKIN